MYIVVIAWLYVTFMMAITEQSIVAGIMTFLFYGALPVAIIVYLAGGRGRRLRRRQQEAESSGPIDPRDQTRDG